METVIIPPLEEQFEELFLFMIKTSKENEDIDELPGNPPKCENIAGRAKYEYWEDVGTVLLSRPHQDYRGEDVKNARECPHCWCVMWSTAAIGQTVKCLQCGGHFQWCS